MRFNKKDYQILDKTLIRIPMLPHSESSKIKYHDLKLKDLKNIIADPFIKEAIFIASPTLIKEIDRIVLQKKPDPEKVRKLTRSVVKYLLRMSTRATPFGLFSGVFSATFGDETKIKINTENHSRRTRLNFDILASLYQEITSRDIWDKKLIYYTNNSVYRLGNDYRYIKTSFTNDKKRHTLNQIRSSVSLIDTLTYFKNGASIKSCLKSFLKEGYDRIEMLSYLNSLIKSQVLQPETFPYTVGSPYFPYLIDVLEKRAHKETSLIMKLKEVNAEIKRLDESMVNRIEAYEKLKICLNEVLKTNESSLLQVDVFPNGSNSKLNRKEKNIISRGIQLLSQISDNKKNNNLNSFKKKFIKRYVGNPMRLVKALDADSGLGYPLGQENNDYWYLSGLNSNYSERPDKVPALSKFENLLLNKLSMTKDSTPIEITDQDLANLPENIVRMPATFSALTERYIINGRPCYFIPAVGGSTASSLIGRFSNHNPDIDDFMQTIANIEKEYHKEAICAEIDHNPEERTGNILFRDDFRDAIIPLLSGKNSTKSNYIEISEIYLKSENGELILTQGKEGKKIIPYLSNAHNYHKSLLPIYTFLCDFQYSYCPSRLRFDWGELSNTRVYLPRVVYKDVIISKAQWKFNHEILMEFYSESESEQGAFFDMKRFIDFWDLPQLVSLVQNDNFLFLDLLSPIGIELFTAEIKGSSQLLLQESISTEEYSVKDRNGKGYVNQILFSFKNNKQKCS